MPPKSSVFKTPFWAMHEITYEVEKVDTTPEPTEDEPDPSSRPTIFCTSPSAAKLWMNWPSCTISPKTKTIYCTNFSPMKCALRCLPSAAASASSRMASVLAAARPHLYFLQFGDDAYGNSGHRGTGIPAPEDDDSRRPQRHGHYLWLEQQLRQPSFAGQRRGPSTRYAP